MALNKLIPSKVAKLKKPGLHGDGSGLWLRVTPPSARSWCYRYMVDGKAHEMGLGSYPDVSLEKAREKAAEARSLRASGLDPIVGRVAHKAALKAEAAKSVTFRYCASAYIAAHMASWKSAKHIEQWENSLARYVYPTLGELPVADVDRALVIKVLEDIWQTTTETANRVRGRIELILDWAKARDFRTGENPARWRGHLENVFPARSKTRTVKHLAALPYADLPAFMETLKAKEGTATAAVMFVILTVARTSEVTGARWSEIDLDKALWTIPGGRMKAGKEHRVPLSAPAVALLRRQHAFTGAEGFVFPGAGTKSGLSPMTMVKMLRRMGRTETVHGFRSTFRDWAAEQTSFTREACEIALAHAVGDRVENAYRRSDLFDVRRELMASWGRHCTTPTVKAGKVIPIRGKR